MTLHDFAESTNAARSDAILARMLLARKFGTTTFVPADAPGIAAATRDVINASLKFGRERYARSPQRLCAVISASPTENALAVWGARDWVVISQGLMSRLHAVAEKIAVTLRGEVGIGESALGKRIFEVPPPCAEFTSSLSWLLYVGAVAFFVGHEVGHHLEGHDGVLNEPVAGDLCTGSGVEPKEQQALEIGADERGSIVSRQVLTYYLGKLIEERTYTEAEKGEYQVALALILSVGLFLSFAIIRPRSVALKEYSEKEHPPGAVRALFLSMYLSEKIKECFELIPEKIRRHIRIVAIDIAAEAVIGPGSKQEKLLRERSGRPEPVALRAIGLRRAIYDPNLRHYARALGVLRSQLRPRLKPRDR